VPNPSFEDTISCPYNGSIDHVFGWSNGGGTPDYFNSCCNGISPAFSVPNNWGGYQQAATGNGYCAVGIYANYYPNAREFIIAQLTTPLTIGKKYDVSFETSLSLNDTMYFNCAANKLGALLSTVPYDIGNPPPIANFAHIYSTNNITDTTNWSTINGMIIADSVYQYIIIGNFFDDFSTDTLIFKKDTFQTAYYFIDDVSVVEDTTNSIWENKINENYFSADLLNGSMHININKNLKGNNNELTIFNLLGQKIFNQKIQDSKTIINLNTLSYGIYILNMETENQIFNHKFLIIN